MKTKLASAGAQEIHRPANEQPGSGQRDNPQEPLLMKSRQGDSQCKANVFRILEEIHQDSERFQEGMAEAKKSVELLGDGLEELRNSEVQMEEGIASIRCQVLEMEADLVRCRAQVVADDRRPASK